jgi:hypothetical protein
MATTLLEVVNRVLGRLREDPVTDINASVATVQLATLIADVDRDVQDRWNWSTMRETITLETVIGQSGYILPNTTYQTNIRTVNNKTSNSTVKLVPFDVMTRFYQTVPITTGSVWYYTTNGTDAGDNIRVDVYPIPSGVETLYFNVQNKYPAPALNQSLIRTPRHVVELGAVARAYAERGESDRTVARADGAFVGALATAIALDIERTPGEVDWVGQ